MADINDIQFKTIFVEGIYFGVIMMPDGKVYTTTTSLAQALGVESSYILMNYSNNPHAFKPIKHDQFLSLYNLYAKDELKSVLKAHKSHLNLRRIKKDIIFWSSKDMYKHAMRCRSAQSDIFIDNLAERLEQFHIQHGYNEVPNHPLVLSLKQELAQKKEEIDRLKDTNRESASNHGRGLRAHRRPTNWVN